MYTHSDPTASRAIGAAEREWKRKTVLAYRCRTDPRAAERIGDPRRIFTGIFSRLLTDPLEELEKAFPAGRGTERLFPDVFFVEISACIFEIKGELS